jgi:L-amino acid N-acyltransferase YncA
VSATHRRQGIGRELAYAALVEALNLGCTQAYVEVVAEQEALVAMFQDMGFEPAALLPDFVRDGAGDFHDLMLLTHRTDDQFGLHQVLGLDEVLA